MLQNQGLARRATIPPVLWHHSAGVGIHTIYYWRDKGIIQAFQETERSPWWYVVTPEVLDTLREKICRVPVKSK